MSYDPTVSRWTTEDPDSYIEGANLYESFKDNPIHVVDPSGLAGFSIPGQGSGWTPDQIINPPPSLDGKPFPPLVQLPDPKKEKEAVKDVAQEVCKEVLTHPVVKAITPELPVDDLPLGEGAVAAPFWDVLNPSQIGWEPFDPRDYPKPSTTQPTK